MGQEFKEHELHLAGDNTFTLKKPGTNHARMDFILNANFLIVTGDYGCAVFWLTEKASIPSLANYELGYLMSKLQCSDRQKKHYREIWEYQQTWDNFTDEFKNSYLAKFLEERKELDKELEKLNNTPITEENDEDIKYEKEDIQYEIDINKKSIKYFHALMDVIREELKGSCFDPRMEDIVQRQLGEFLYNLPELLRRADIDSAITTGVDTDTIQELIIENIDNLVYKWCEVENEVFSIYLAAIKEIDKRIKVCDYLVVINLK